LYKLKKQLQKLSNIQTTKQLHKI